MVAVTHIAPPSPLPIPPPTVDSNVSTARRPGRFLTYLVATVVALAGVGYLAAADPLAAPGTIGVEREVYLVAEGDTMWTIARQFAPAGEAGQFLEHMVALNGTSTVEVGQTLAIPVG